MTISAQCLDDSEKAKLATIRAGKSPAELKQMDKELAQIVQNAIAGAGALEAENIKTRIALALRRKYRLD